MGIYTITYLFNSFGFATNEKSKKIINYIVIAFLIFMSGTRYYMGGSDVLVYENVYNGAPSVGTVLLYLFTGINHGVNTDYETGFILICSIIKGLGFSYFGFTLVFATSFYLLMYKGLKEFVADWAPFWALFMYKIMFYNTFISIRQGLTMAVFCYALKYIRDKKIVKYFIWSFIAFLIHRGAIILFPLYFIQYIPMSSKIIKYVALLFAPTWLIRGQVNLGGIIDRIISIIGFANKSEGWSEVTEPISFIHTLECYITVILVLIFYDKIISTKKQKEVKLVLQLFILTIPIFTLLSNWIVMTREKDYFVMMYGILFGYILEGRTTSPIEYDEYGNELFERNDRVGCGNARVISLVILAACFIGMTRYVMVFDGGVLKHFTSFITQGVSIFR